MARARGVECDRCKKLGPEGDHTFLQLNLRRRGDDDAYRQSDRYDICSACAHDLAKWVGAYPGAKVSVFADAAATA